MDHDTVLRNLSKTKTTLADLKKLKKDYKGIIIAYWTKYWRNSYPKFAGEGSWFQMMEAKEPEAVSDFTLDDDAIEIADRLMKQSFKLDVDTILANIVKGIY